MHSWIWTLTKLHRPPEGLRCTSKTKIYSWGIFKAIWLWVWEVDRVIFCLVVWSIPFSYGILPLLINSRFDWKSSCEKCFSLAIEFSIFVVKVKYKKSNGRTSINPTGGLSHAPFIEAEVGPKHTKRVFKNGTLANALFPMVRRVLRVRLFSATRCVFLAFFRCA